MLTIYECPICGLTADPRRWPTTAERPWKIAPRCSGFVTRGMHDPVELREVRMFREEDVRPLYEAAQTLASGHDPHGCVETIDAFLAPEDWK